MVYNAAWLLSYTHNAVLVDGNFTIAGINDKMTSSLSSVVHYHLLNCDIIEDEMIKEDQNVKKDEYPSLSASAPTIIFTDDFEDQRNRCELLYLSFLLWDLDISVLPCIDIAVLLFNNDTEKKGEIAIVYTQ